MVDNFDRDRLYWNDYYGGKKQVFEPSKFAEYISKYLDKGKSLIELGCGNGRDSVFFHDIGLKVLGIDASDSVVQKLKSNETDNLLFECDDFVCTKELLNSYDYCYSRFTIHAITKAQEKELLPKIYRSLRPGGKLFIETRGVNDELYGKGTKVDEDAYIFDSHFRRFIRIEQLVESLTNIGFNIVEADEKRDFAPFGDENPLIIRIVAEKNV